MKKLYLFLAVIILGLISLAGYFYVILIENELDSQAHLMMNQVRICGNNIKQSAELLEQDLRYITDLEDWDDFFNEGKNYNSHRTRIRRFYTMFDELIDSIYFKSNNVTLAAYLSAQNYYSVKMIDAGTENFIHKKRIALADSNNTRLIMPIYNEDGAIIGNILVYLNTENYILHEFSHFYIGPDSWELIFIPGKGITNYNFAGNEKFNKNPHLEESVYTLLNSQIQYGLHNTAEFKLLTNDSYINAIAAYYPIEVYNNKYGIIFVTNKQTLLTSLVVNFMIILGIILILLLIIIFVFFGIIKQRNQAVKELTQNEKELTKLVDQQQLLLTHTNEFVYRIDLLGKVNYVTDSVETVLGYTTSEFKTNVKKFLSNHPDNLTRLNTSLDKINKGEKTEGYKIEANHKTGKKIILEINVNPVNNSDGVVEGAICVASDVSEFHKTERLLAESKERFRFISEHMKDIVCLHNPEGKFTYISPSVKDILGFEAEELININPHDMQVEDLKVLKGGLVTEGKNYTQESLFQFRVKDKSNNYLWVETLTQPFFDEHGKITSILSTSRDITERMESQLKIRESEILFRSLFEEAAIGIAQVDNNWNCMNVNMKMQELLGYKKADLLNKDFRNILNLEYAPDDNIKHDKLLNGEISSYKIEKQLALHKHLVIWSRITISLVQKDLNQPDYMIIMIEDITEKILHEEEMKKAMRAAESGSKAKSEFLATMSHEIRTPMNGVIGMTSLLSETELSKEQYEYVKIIRTSGEALLELINDILDYSKIEAGRMDLEEAPFSLNQCVEEAIDLCASSAEKKGVELAYLLDNEVPEVIQGDISRLRQVLVNLIGNAIKFTPYGEIFVQVSLVGQHENKAKLQFRVKDTGIGIPHEKIGNLFHAFSQIDASTTRKFGGTGLGLAICKKIVTLMDGDIWAESEENKGSTFYFTIQVGVISAKVIKDYNYEILKNKKVLIVDDNQTNLKIFTTITQKWGLTPIPVESGQDAITKIKAGERVDVIILDMQMPEMNGIEVARNIKDIVEYKNIPIIFITSFSFSEEEKRELEKYLSAHLTKPIKQSQLFEALYYIFYTEPKEMPNEEIIETDSGKIFAEELPLRILAAEDNPVNQKFIIHVLKKLGYTAEVAGNGKEVIDLIEKRPYDLIFMDIQMPVMDGLEATDVILKKWPNTRPKIIALTANALKEDRDRCLERGMDDYMSKPVTLNKIKDMLFKHGSSLLNKNNKNRQEAKLLQDEYEDLLGMDVLSEYLGNEEDKMFFRDVVEMSKGNIKDNLEELKELLEKGEFEKLTKIAHTMKGLSYNVGAKKLGDIAKQIQDSGKTQNSWEISKLISKFAKSIDITFEKIENLLK